MRVCVVTAGVWIRATRPARLPTLAPRAQRMMSQFAVPNGAGTRHELAHVKALLAKSPEPPRRRSFTVDWASRRSERRERTMRGVRLCRASMVERRACPDGSAWPLDVTAGLHFRQREEVAAFRAVFAIVEDAFDLVNANVSWPSAVWSCTPFGGTEASATRCRAARAGTTLSSSQRSSTNARANSVDEQRGPRRQRGPRPCAGLVAMAATRTCDAPSR